MLCLLYTVLIVWTVSTYTYYDTIMTDFGGTTVPKSNVHWWHLLYVSFFWATLSVKFIKDESLKQAIGSYNLEIAAFSLFMFYLTKLDYAPNELYTTLAVIAPLAVLTYYQYKLQFKNKRTLIINLWKQLLSRL